jgi:large subunit ribosomal protein L6
MTNISKEKIYIPSSITVTCQGWKLEASNTTRKIVVRFPVHTHLLFQDDYLQVNIPKNVSCISGCLLRKTKTLLHGLALRYVTRVQFVGVGYRARIENKVIILKLGYSHEIIVKVPENLEITIIKNNQVRISGFNFEEVRQFAYRLRSFRQPEPFKGKGIICIGEEIRRKEGKKKNI